MRYSFAVICLLVLSCGCAKRDELSPAELAGILDVNWWKIPITEQSCASVDEISIGLFRRDVGYTNICTASLAGLDTTGGVIAVVSLQRLPETEDTIAAISLRNPRGTGYTMKQSIERPLGTPLTSGSGILNPIIGKKIPLIGSGTLSFEQAEAIIYVEVRKKGEPSPSPRTRSPERRREP